MSRRTLVILLAVSALALAFFTQELGQPQEDQPMLAIIVIPLLAAAVLASSDLRRRGHRWGWAMLAASLIQPIGLILYVIFSGRRGYRQPAAAA